MNMRTFQAETVQEALLQVKNELGPEAMILRTSKKHGTFKGSECDYIEVVAAQDEALFARPGAAPATPTTETPAGTYRRDRKVEGRAAAAPAATPVPSPDGFKAVLQGELELLLERIESPLREVKVLHGGVRDLLSAVNEIRTSFRQLDVDGVPAGLEESYERLVAADLDPDLARELVRRLSNLVPAAKRGDAAETDRWLRKLIANRVSVFEGFPQLPGRPVVVMLAGPTGVGKTTTIAKLAGVYRMEKGMKVGVICADGYRLGAAEQLGSFCRAAGIPMETAYSPAEAEEALGRLRDRDLILIDTAGRGQSDASQWEELRELVARTAPDQIHLVLSCTTKGRDLRNFHTLYRDLGITHLLFTKLDESLGVGGIYNLAAETGKPVSFLCNGQDIPDSILPAGKEGIADLILEGACLEAA